jgi:hypothetical protein
MKYPLLTLCSILALASPVMAERLNFDHRLYPPLKAVFDDDRDEMITYDNSNPKYVIDRIAIQGKSATDWTEALDIIARTPSRDVKTADDWFKEIQLKTGKSCDSKFAIIAQDENSITFSRRSTQCGKDKVQTALYRIVTGERSLFLLNPIYRAEMDETMKQKWLAVLASARLQK